MCLSIDRPRQGSLFDALRPVDFDRVLNNFNDQDDEETDDDDEEEEIIYGNANRPKLVLSGPYHYEVSFSDIKLKNISLNYFEKKTKTKS